MEQTGLFKESSRLAEEMASANRARSERENFGKFLSQKTDF